MPVLIRGRCGSHIKIGSRNWCTAGFYEVKLPCLIPYRRQTCVQQQFSSRPFVWHW